MPNSESRIFTDAEILVMKQRMNQDKTDRTGLFCNRVRPKILEMFSWWDRREELEWLVEDSRRVRRGGERI